MATNFEENLTDGGPYNPDRDLMIDGGPVSLSSGKTSELVVLELTAQVGTSSKTFTFKLNLMKCPCDNWGDLQV